MSYLIDSSSLINLSIYYAPLDSSQRIFRNKIETLFEDRSLILLNAVKEEVDKSNFQLVPDTFNSFSRIKVSNNIYPNAIEDDSLLVRVKEHWTTTKGKNLSIIDYDKQLASELEKADFQLMFQAIKSTEHLTIVTDENVRLKSKKMFKKIPMICKSEKITCIDSIQFLKALGIQVTYQFS